MTYQQIDQLRPLEVCDDPENRHQMIVQQTLNMLTTKSPYDASYALHHAAKI